MTAYLAICNGYKRHLAFTLPAADQQRVAILEALTVWYLGLHCAEWSILYFASNETFVSTRV